MTFHNQEQLSQLQQHFLTSTHPNRKTREVASTGLPHQLLKAKKASQAPTTPLATGASKLLKLTRSEACKRSQGCLHRATELNNLGAA